MVLKEVKKSLVTLPLFKKVVVGVSGGADSVALAHMLIKLGYDVTIAHLNHGLRGKESDADAKFVRNLAQKWDVTFVTCQIKVPKKGNLENESRKLRYGFLEKVRHAKKAKFIAVAHHLDDQIETILMHMQRGAGLRGVCGMRLKNDNIIRPLLSVCKKDLVSYLKMKGQDFRTDKSNFDLNIKRNYLRHVAIPKLRKESNNFEKKLLELSSLAQENLKKIEKKVQSWIKNNVTNQSFSQSDFLKLPEELQSEVLFALTGYLDVYSKHIQEVKEIIQKGITGKQKKVGNLNFRIEYKKVVFNKNVIKITVLRKRKLGGREIKWGNFKIKYQGDKSLYVRRWKFGDRFQPAGMKGSKKLQDFFTDQKIPQLQREHIPIIVDQKDRILSISDFRVAKNADNLKQYLQINKIK